MNITNEEIESHLNYPQPSDVTSMNINSIDVSFIILGWVSCVFDAGGGGGWGSTGNLWISIVKSWLRILAIKRADTKKFDARNSVLGFCDFPSQPISGQSEKRYGMQNCSREQCLTVVFCGPFSSNYARECKTAVGYLWVAEQRNILNQQ